MAEAERAWIDGGGEPNPRLGRQGRSEAIVVGLVNNMPDAAFSATEAQFRRLIDGAKGARDVQLKLFFLPEVTRSEGARAAVEARYAPIDALTSAGVDALIVTGAEPCASALQEEPYWPRLSDLVAWARTNTVSTLWSCLSAHAAVLHLDGVQRRPLARKCSGVYDVQRVQAHPLTAGDHTVLRVPHSRLNTLDQAELAQAGYRILTQSDQIGVDAFIREEPSLFVFLQGHPEYDPQSLMLEYRRDVRRMLRGERTRHPDVPEGYFDAETERRLRALAESTRLRPSGASLKQCVNIMRDAPPVDRWTGWSSQLYRNWLDLIEARGRSSRAQTA